MKNTLMLATHGMLNMFLIVHLTNYQQHGEFDDDNSLIYAHAASNGEPVNCSDYTEEECPLALCHTNDAVDAINKQWNDYPAAQPTETK